MKNFVSQFILKNPKLPVSLGMLAVLFAIGFGFKIGNSQAFWLWSDYPFVAILLVLVGFACMYLWAYIEKVNYEKKIEFLRQEIQDSDEQRASQIFIGTLSLKEKEVLKLITEGKSNKEIAQILFIELSTVKTHINHIYKTLQISNRKEAIKIGKKF